MRKRNQHDGLRWHHNSTFLRPTHEQHRGWLSYGQGLRGLWTVMAAYHKAVTQECAFLCCCVFARPLSRFFIIHVFTNCGKMYVGAVETSKSATLPYAVHVYCNEQSSQFNNAIFRWWLSRIIRCKVCFISPLPLFLKKKRPRVEVSTLGGGHLPALWCKSRICRHAER